MLAATPVPEVTTARIRPVRTLAFSFEVTVMGFASLFSAGSLTIDVGLRTPSLATVCATEAIPRGVASTRPCPNAVTESSVWLVSSLKLVGMVMAFGWVAAVAAAL